MNAAPRITTASTTDCTALCRLVNRAYRGEGAKQGWTTEADLLEGIRIDEEGMRTLLTTPGSAVLKATDEQGKIVGCVHLELRPPATYLGMLTVDPALQNGGLGSVLISAGEDWAKEQGCTKMEMTVISVRHALIAWYCRKGYRLTGEEKPFPTDPRFGIPRQPLHFVVLQKTLP